MNSGNTGYHSVQNILSSHSCLKRCVCTHTHKTRFFFGGGGLEIWSVKLRKEHRLRVVLYASVSLQHSIMCKYTL
jgi:hypothetical protein